MGKHIVLVIQDCLLEYLRREFSFGHISGVRVGDSMHIHSYKLNEVEGEFKLQLDTRLSTDAEGVAKCLGIQADTRVELEAIINELEKRISAKTAFSIDAPISPAGRQITE